MKISRISAQAFRGFPGIVNFYLSDGVTVIYAPNGSGKTSLSEAFEWTLYGEVARKIRSKTQGEFGQEFLRSVHAKPQDETWAEVELIKDDGTHIVLRRVMKKGGDTILYADNLEIGTIEQIGINTGLSFRPCLGQSEIKAFIDTEPKERWKQISAILGLGGFEQVRDRLMKLKTDTDKMPNVLRTREAARRAVAPLTPQGQNPLGQEPSSLKKTITQELKLKESSTWLEVNQESEKRITDLLSLDKKPTSLDDMILGPESINVADCETEVTKINAGIKSQREWHTANRKQKFIEAGLAITEQPQCPFCGEDTITNHKHTELAQFVKEKEKTPQELNSQFVSSLSELQAIKAAPINTQVVGSLIDALASEEDLVNELTPLPGRQSALNTKLTDLGNLARSYQAATHSSDSTPITEVQSLGEQITTMAQELSADYTNLRKDAQVTKEKIQAKFKGLTADERLLLERLQSIKQLANGITPVIQAWKISKRQEELDKLIKDFQQQEKNAVQSFEKELADDVRSYLEQLSNSKSLKFGHFNIKPGARRQAGLEATAYNVPVNPTSMFSEAQGNSLGLSLYFSQRVNRNPSWKSIILDDPVQSMDDDHKGNLISLLSRLETSHQIIVFTHDRAFKNSLAEQFVYSPKYLEYEISKSDKSPVPQIKEILERFDQLLNYAELSADESSIQRETAFNSLRKATEKLVKGIAKNEKVKLDRGSDLEQQIKQLLNHPLSAVECGTLQRIRHDCNPGSHDSDATTAPGIIKAFIKDLRTIKESHLPS